MKLNIMPKIPNDADKETEDSMCLVLSILSSMFVHAQKKVPARASSIHAITFRLS